MIFLKIKKIEKMMSLNFLKWVHTEYGYTLEQLIEHYDDVMTDWKTHNNVEEEISTVVNDETITVFKYTPKTYIIIGETKKYRDDFHNNFQCKWMNSLKQEPFVGRKGWLLSASKFEKFKEAYEDKFVFSN